jgi:hypothetical protein
MMRRISMCPLDHVHESVSSELTSPMGGAVQHTHRISDKATCMGPTTQHNSAADCMDCYVVANSSFGPGIMYECSTFEIHAHIGQKGVPQCRGGKYYHAERPS